MVDYGLTTLLEKTRMTTDKNLGAPNDAINNPKHYNSNPSGIEAIEFIEHLKANVANAMKYLYRGGMKGDIIEDYRKAIWYTFREIRRILVFERQADADELSEARFRKDMATVKEILDRWVDRA